jgi:hypothetical protein
MTLMSSANNVSCDTEFILRGRSFVFKLHKPTAHLKLYQSSPYYTCIRIYNNLPDDLASQVTHKKQFVWNLKKYLIERPYYTLQEFMNAQ